MLNKYQWAAIVAALLLPGVLLAATRRPLFPNQFYRNLRAFLQMIQYAEGTWGPNAYRMLFGGGLFNDYDRHPGIAVTRSGITSTAAGAYQFLLSTWSSLQKELKLQDFSPVSQDKATVELIRRKGALPDVLSGRIADAIYKCRKVWASFPGAGYGQGERPITDLLRFYVQAGGQLLTN